jgi:hypothetical protein
MDKIQDVGAREGAGVVVVLGDGVFGSLPKLLLQKGSCDVGLDLIGLRVSKMAPMPAIATEYSCKTGATEETKYDQF